MRKINESIVQYFIDWKDKTMSNTKVKVEDWNVFMYLHWNIIAVRPVESQTDLTLHLPIRFQTSTTKSRVNAILDMMQFPLHITQIKTVWFFVNTIDWTRYEVQPGPNFVHK